MLHSYHKFVRLIEDTNNVTIIYKFITDTITVPIDLNDLLRWQWIQCVSALDKLVHDLVRVGMVEIYLGRRVSTQKFDSFAFDMKTHQEIFNDPTNAVMLFEGKVMACNGYKSFQSPDKIIDALAYVWNEDNKWRTLSNKMGRDEKWCKTTLINIVNRRNQIVHEGDYTDIFERREVFEEDIIKVRDFILELGESIYECVK